MTVEDTAKALMAMSDRERRIQVGSGDFTGLPDLDLSKEERRILINAARGAADDDDVDGFGSFAPPYVPVGPVVTLMGAIRYVEDGMGQSNTAVRAEFNAWTAQIGAQGTW